MDHRFREYDYLPKGIKVYQNEDRLHYMDQSLDLSQPDYKRFRLGKYAHDVVGRESKRNNSFDGTTSNSAKPIKHPYEWEINEKKPIPHSFIPEPKQPSTKVTSSAVKKNQFIDNIKNNDPIAIGNEIAVRLKYIKRDDQNKSTYLNTKYLKNYSTLNHGGDDVFSQTKATSFQDPRKISEILAKNLKKRDVSPKVGNNVVEADVPFKTYSPLKEKYLQRVHYV